MRKLLALSMVALLALTLVIAALGCGQKAAETPAATESTPTETMGGSDSMADSSAMMADSSSTMGSETTSH